MEEKYFKAFNIQIITPVHIGCETSEKLKKNFDFIIDNGEVKLIDLDKILAVTNNHSTIADALINGEIEKIKEIATNCKALIKTNISINANKITKNLKNKLNKNPIIPGSSIKGAVTSVLLEYLTRGFDYKKRKKLIEDQKEKQTVLGNVTEGNHFMRFLQFTDTEFENNTIVETKLFNLQGKNKGGSKHGTNTFSKLNNSRFVFAYEVIPINSLSKIYLGLNEPAYKLLQNNEEDKNQIIPEIKEKLNRILNKKFSELFRIINEHTKNYIDKELDFFNSIEAVEHKNKLINAWEKLKIIVDNAIKDGNKYCILRVGFGCGFHSITGDWSFKDSHKINCILCINSNEKKNSRRGAVLERFDGPEQLKLKFDQIEELENSGEIKLSAKTRKFIFTKNKNNDIIFHPFGFVKIGDFEPEKNDMNINIGNKTKISSIPIEEKKSYQPKYQSNIKLKKGAIVNAVIIENKPPLIYFKVLVDELKPYTYSLKYAAGLNVNTYCCVKITSINLNDPSKHTFSFVKIL